MKTGLSEEERAIGFLLIGQTWTKRVQSVRNKCFLPKSLQAAWACGQLLGKGETSYLLRCNQLKEQIHTYFWDPDQGAFIDSFESGKRNITRHANIFAVLWDYADARQRETIITNVLDNETIPQINTPYFKFYELEVLCQIGRLNSVIEKMQEYWGGMLRLGATTFWEEYNPDITGLDRYEMYGDRYGKSLCHAWGASPIYILGRYYLDVRPTSAGYDTFVVEPQLGGLEWIKGAVPINGGTVSLEFTTDVLQVVSDKPGGLVRFQGQEYPLPADRPLRLRVR